MYFILVLVLAAHSKTAKNEESAAEISAALFNWNGFMVLPHVNLVQSQRSYFMIQPVYLADHTGSAPVTSCSTDRRSPN